MTNFLLVSGCDSSCATGLMQCTGSTTTCCNFYEDDMCISQCTPPLVPYEDFTCGMFNNSCN